VKQRGRLTTNAVPLRRTVRAEEALVRVVGARTGDDGEVGERGGTRAKLVVVSVGSEDDRTRRFMERCSQRKKWWRRVA
jgi:hypothetical protein